MEDFCPVRSPFDSDRYPGKLVAGSHMEKYRVPAKQTRVEMRVINSRFIATAAPAFTVDEARAFIAGIKSEFSDASHNVPAFLVGHGASVIAHCSDDGEPAGTAGRPILAVLRGSGLGDTVLVVTRYFGGTKLGTGGLVRAYSDAARQVLGVLPLAVKEPTHTLSIICRYSLYEPVRRLVAQHGGEVLEEEFAADVTVTVRLSTERFPDFQSGLAELSAGQVEAEIVAWDESTVVP